MMNPSKANEAVACFDASFNCSQAILSTYCGYFGMDKKTALQIACGFGSGMGRQQEICGAVAGAYMLIGLKHGRHTVEDVQAKEKTYALVREFAAQFKELHKSTNCRELLGADMMDEADKQAVAERLKTFCPGVVRDATEIVERLLFSEGGGI